MVKLTFSGLPIVYPKSVGANNTLFNVSRGSNRNTLASRRLLGNYWTMQSTDKFYDVVMDAVANISAIMKAMPSICVMHPLTYKVVVSELRAEQRVSFFDGAESWLRPVTTQGCPVNKMYLLDENCIGFHFLAQEWVRDKLPTNSIMPEEREIWSGGVGRWLEKGPNVVDFARTPNGSYFHQVDDEGYELRASFNGNLVVINPGSGCCIELDSSKAPKFKS